MAGRIEHHAYSIAAAAALAGAAGILLFLVVGSGTQGQRLPAMVRSTEIKIAPEISGRLRRFAVKPGQNVRVGDELVEMISPELSASLVLAEAQVGEARAARPDSPRCRRRPPPPRDDRPGP